MGDLEDVSFVSIMACELNGSPDRFEPAQLIARQSG